MQDCDFIPASYLESQNLKGAIRLRISCAVVLIAIMGLWVGAHHYRCASAEAMINEVAGQQRQIDIHLAKKQSMEVEQARLRDRGWLIDQLRDNASVVVLFSDISRRMPKTVVLTELSVRCASLSQYVEEETPPTPVSNKRDTRGARGKTSAAQNDRDETPVKEQGINQIVMIGIASEIPDVIEFAAALEESPLLVRVQMEMKDSTVWAGCQARQFELRCDLVKQVRNG